MTELVETIAKALVDQPDRVIVTDDGGRGESLTLQVAGDDMGKVIGKRGRIAKALRTVVKAAGVKQNLQVTVEIVSEDEASGAQTAEPEQEMAAEEPAGEGEETSLPEGVEAE